MHDLRRAQAVDGLVQTELARTRAGAVAWSTGLAGLLAALLGFSLIRGRTDVRELAVTWAAAVGILLAIALVSGALAALLLLRAAHGFPRVADVQDVEPEVIANHKEALTSAVALRRGITLSLVCAGLLSAAVALTWYGPGRAEPMIRIGTSTQTVCGTVVRTANGAITIRGTGGETSIPLSSITAVGSVPLCPPGH
ncbi:hypothetical protein [Streptomyces sp. NPDC097981]|uniref:hypothetical protein n=1 Tax=Streptomyces sp. NPDC097981 TaxID=3155428 RepID=UPI003334431D